MEVRRIRRQGHQIDLGVGGECSYQRGVLIAGVVADDTDATFGMDVAIFNSNRQKVDGFTVSSVVSRISWRDSASRAPSTL